MPSRRSLATGLIVAVMALLTTLFSAVPVGATGHPDEGTPTYEVTITNDTTGQYLTPPNWAAHSPRVDVFSQGRAPSEGVKAVAELGQVPVLAAELEDKVGNAGRGVSGVAGDGPIAPGESVSFTFSSDEGRFSVVSMIICTNDGFGGVDSNVLPRHPGQTRTYNLADYDAGAELNTELRADIVPAPFCSTPEGEPGGNGEDQPEIDGFNRINRHPTLKGVGDLPDRFDWKRGSVGTVTISRVVPEPVEATYQVTVTNGTSGQYLTPPNFAAHTRTVDVFQVGKAPSPGVVAVAELGQVPVLAAELQSAVDDQGLGVSGVIDSDAGPIEPGATREWEFTTDATRFSLVSMIICTNDGFGGVDSQRLPGNVGDAITYNLGDYDAGAELNTQLRADIVPAPFCSTPAGAPGGNGEDQPEIDGFNRITPHPSQVRGRGDLPQSFDWRRGSVGEVTITRVG